MFLNLVSKRRDKKLPGGKKERQTREWRREEEGRNREGERKEGTLTVLALPSLRNPVCILYIYIYIYIYI